MSQKFLLFIVYVTASYTNNINIVFQQVSIWNKKPIAFVFYIAWFNLGTGICHSTAFVIIKINLSKLDQKVETWMNSIFAYSKY